MIFEELDRSMRAFETVNDHRVLPGISIVARLDGRNFTRLTKETLACDAPFDERFRDLMADTVEHLMRHSGFAVTYGYTQSDEISLLLAPDDDTFGRKLRKIVSVLAGEASAAFSLAAGVMACFDCRVSQLPTSDLVIDYFRWRSEDAHRNALNAHCYWLLRGQGMDASGATGALDGMSVAGKNELLFRNGTNFNTLPEWQRRGVGFFWDRGTATPDPQRHRADDRIRGRSIVRDLALPMKDAYDAYVRSRIGPARNDR